MALKRLVIDGFGQLELNNVAFRRDGRIEAQCALDSTDFASVPAENGMLLAVDNVNRVVKFADDASLPIALNYTTEHMYDERTPGLRNFRLEPGTFLPRLGYLSVGDKFTTNCVSYDSAKDSTWTSDAEFKKALAKDKLATTPVYGGISADGSIAVSATKPSAGPVLLVVAATTMPDGQFGIKFQALTV